MLSGGLLWGLLALVLIVLAVLGIVALVRHLSKLSAPDARTGRQPKEAVHAELGALADPASAAGLGDHPVAVMCGHGERAMTGASLLAATGTAAVSVLSGDPGDWANAAGQTLGHG